MMICSAQTLVGKGRHFCNIALTADLSDHPHNIVNKKPVDE